MDVNVVQRWMSWDIGDDEDFSKALNEHQNKSVRLHYLHKNSTPKLNSGNACSLPELRLCLP